MVWEVLEEDTLDALEGSGNEARQRYYSSLSGGLVKFVLIALVILVASALIMWLILRTMS